ncbi:MAG: peptidase M15 [Myxococcales bacterium]
MSNTLRRAIITVLLLVAGVARAEAPAGLAKALDAIVADGAIGKARVGAAVMDVTSGELWYGHDGDGRYNVASNAKLLTTAAALLALGPDATFPTEVYGSPELGAIQGDLVIRGRGNPKLMAKDIAHIANAIKAAGVRRVTGGVVVDDSLFGGASLPPGYDLKDTDEAYRCSIGALTMEYGAIAVTFKPGASVGSPARVSVAPDGGDVDFSNQASTVQGKEERLTVRARGTADGRTLVTVTGTIGVANKGGLVRRRVDDPGLVTGRVLREALRRRGITVEGDVVRGRAPEAEPPMITVPSPTVAALAKDCNEWSNNHMAEVLLLHVGAASAGAPGTAAKGAAAITKLLEAAGATGGFEIHNGSGLYGGQFMAPRHMVAFLRHVWGLEKVREPFLASLPVAGKTGTLKGRMAKTGGRVHAKTGTLDDVITLSGYVKTQGGRWLAFAVLVNDLKEPAATARRLQDRFVSHLAGL